MSHTITLEGVRITDLDLLAECIKHVAGNQAKIVKGQKTFRAYPNQPNHCDHAIVLTGHGQNYDIGLRRSQDGSYTMAADFTMMAYKSPFSHKSITIKDAHRRAQDVKGYDLAMSQYATGALVQEYALRTAEEQAAILGRRTQRIPGKNGTVALEIFE